MNERQKADLAAGLSLEVDAWLAGGPTRRTFMRKFGELTGMIALCPSALSAISRP